MGKNWIRNEISRMRLFLKISLKHLLFMFLLQVMAFFIDIERRKNRLLKFCYVSATSAAHNRLLFFIFLLRPFTVLMQQTRQAVRAIKQSIFLYVYAFFPQI
jgi:hypothetical protein